MNTFAPIPELDEWIKTHKVNTYAIRSESVRKGAALANQQHARLVRAIDKALTKNPKLSALYWRGRQAA